MEQTSTIGAANSSAAVQKERRFPKRIRVSVEGVDANGNTFKQSAETINVSASGARLDGPACVRGAGEVITVKRLWKKAKCRVVWMGRIGTPEACQIGVRLLDPGKRVW